MTKKKFVLSLFLFIIFNINAQINQEEKDLTLTSEKILNKNVSIAFGGGKLKNALDLIASHNSINISYSDNRIAPISIQSIAIDQKKLSYVLEQILKDTGFDYLLIGRIVLIVENNDKPVTNHEDTLQHISSSSTNRNHIYNPDHSLNNYISQNQKRIITKIHKKELKWVAQHRQNESDTITSDVQKPKLFDLSKIMYLEGGLYAHFGLRTDINRIKVNNVSSVNWQRDLKYEVDINTSFFPEIGIGYRYNNWMIETGLSYKRLIVKESWIEETKKGANSENASDNAKKKNEEQKYISFINNRVITLPIKAQYTHFMGNVFVMIGAGMQLSYLKTYQNDLYILKNYYNEQLPDNEVSTFKEKEHNTMLSGFVEMSTGVVLSNKLMFLTGISYANSFTPFYSNTLTRLSVNAFSLSWSVNYFLR